MDVRCNRYCFSVGLFIVVSLFGAQAASLSDQFEVAKTKLLFNLSSGQFDAAAEEAEQQLSLFETTPFENEWRYWLAISQSRNQQFDQAIRNFNRIRGDLFASHRLDIELGMAYLQQGDRVAARRAFQRWLAKYPDDISGRYYLAFSFFPNQPERAISLLKPLDEQFHLLADSSSNPISHDQIVYLLVASFYALGEAELANDQAERLMAWPGGSDFANAAQTLSSSVDSTANNKRWLGDIALLTSYDSNISLENDARADMRTALSGAVQYRFNQNIRVGYQGYYSAHWQSSDLNLWANYFTAVYTLPMYLGYTDIEIGYRHNFLQQQLWQQKYEATALWRLPSFAMGGQLATASEGLPEKETTYSVMPFLQVQLPSSVLNASVDTSLLLRWQADELAASLLKVRAQTQHEWVGWQLSPSLQWQLGRYSEAQVRDSLQQFSLGLSARRSLVAQGYLDLGGEYVLALVEPDVFSYQRAIASLTLGWRF